LESKFIKTQTEYKCKIVLTQTQTQNYIV